MLIISGLILLFAELSRASSKLVKAVAAGKVRPKLCFAIFACAAIPAAVSGGIVSGGSFQLLPLIYCARSEPENLFCPGVLPLKWRILAGGMEIFSTFQ